MLRILSPVLRRIRGYVIGTALIASGRVRHARRAAFAPDTITILCFHKPRKALFLKCVLWLIKYGYSFVSADEVIDWMWHGRRLPEGAVWFTFDDGWREQLDDVLPIVERYRIPVTLFIPTRIVGGEGKYPWLHDERYPLPVLPAEIRGCGEEDGEREAFTESEVRRAASCPVVTVGSHTATHALLPYCPDERLRQEILESKSRLESWSGKAVRTFAYPEGLTDPRAAGLLEACGIEVAVTTMNSFATRACQWHLLPRFSVGDDIAWPQAVCSMVGVWRPVADSLIRLAGIQPAQSLAQRCAEMASNCSGSAAAR